MSTALVTGASSGIGEQFARRLAAVGHQLVVVARDEERLDKLAEELRASWHVDVQVLPADLATADGCRTVEERVSDRSRPIDLLVNNAGFSLGVDLVHSDVDDEERMLLVMALAPLRISKAALPGMIERGHGDIITVASVAGLVSHNSYGAVKAWEVRFSRAMSVQLAGTGVRAIALCPGLTHTDFHRRGGVDARRAPSWLWLDADRVVQECLRDLRAGKTVSVPTRRYRLLVGVGRLLPTSLVSRLAPARRRSRA
jgi:short-subunit dehydrogenase